jgi:undecaprenyl diphosphate synthase
MLKEVDNKVKLIDLSKLPSHIAFIMDGNRRWAKIRNLPSIIGHKKGFSVFKDIILFSKNIGIKELSFFAFSKENWNRTKDEVNFLLKLMSFYAKREISRMIEEGVKIRIVGDIEQLSSDLREVFMQVEEYSKNFDKIVVNVMINYSGQYDIIQAIKRIMDLGYKSEDVNLDLLNSFLLVGSPDLLIRTGSELRISNFMLFQLAYTELYFSEKMWPDFEISDFIDVILDYQKRERRWGK